MLDLQIEGHNANMAPLGKPINNTLGVQLIELAIIFLKLLPNQVQLLQQPGICLLTGVCF